MASVKNKLSAGTVVVVLLGLAIFSVVLTSINNQHQLTTVRNQAACNQQFKQAIEQRDQLSRDNERLLAVDSQNISELVLGLSSVQAFTFPPAEGTGGKVDILFKNYRAKTLENAAAKDRLAEQAAAKPIPDITCR